MSARLLLAVVIALPGLGGCTAAAFLAANIPATVGSGDRRPGIAYGSEARQRLDVYVPGDTGEAHPVVVFVHGGSWQNGSKDGYRFVGSALAERGVVAVVINYRLNPAVRFPAYVSDAALAVAWTFAHVAEYRGDPAQVFLMGHSAGAHIAALVGLDRRYLAAQGTTSDRLRGVIGLSGPYDFAIDSEILRQVFGSPADPADTQPVAFARGDAPPLLLIHGTGDRICRVGQAVKLVELTRRAGGEAELRLYPGLGHGDTVAGFARVGRSRAPTLDDVVAFVQRVAVRPLPEAR